MLPNSVSGPQAWKARGNPGPMLVIYMNVAGDGCMQLNFID
jgi:hypothetical protein